MHSSPACPAHQHAQLTSMPSPQLRGQLCMPATLLFLYHSLLYNIIKVEVHIALYPLLSCPWDCSKRFTLPRGRPDHSNAISTSLGSIQPCTHTHTLHEDFSFRYPSLSVARYSFIQLSELWQRGMNEIATKVSKRQQEDSNLGSLD